MRQIISTWGRNGFITTTALKNYILTRKQPTTTTTTTTTPTLTTMSRGVSTTDLTEETIKEFREAFALFDLNNDGNISAEELGIFMRKMGQQPNDKELRKMIAEVDADGNGLIDFSEFVTLLARKMNNSDKDAEIKEAFDVYDKDRNGRISRDELMTVMRDLGSKLSEADIDRMIQEADSNGDGEIRKFYSRCCFV